MPVGDLADEVASVLTENLQIGDEYPIWGSYDDDRPSHYENHGDPISWWISEILQLDNINDLVDAVCGELTSQSHYDFMQGGEPRFDEEIRYVRKRFRPKEAELSWIEFKNGIMHDHRFFNEKAKAFLKWLFEGVDSLHSHGFADTEVVRTIAPTSGIVFYRARRCDFFKDIKPILEYPAQHLAAPPKELARAGRMNPAGVPMFYGAFDRDTCIAELRPPVGGAVISGEFRITRPIRVLDFKRLEDTYHESPLSEFQPDYRKKQSLRHFLQTLHSKISYPVLPNAEHEYLTTQVIAEYLSTQHVPPIDGVIFSSAQNKEGLNVVLFSHVVSADPISHAPDIHGLTVLDFSPTKPGIEFVPDSLLVHNIKGAQYHSESQNVSKGQIEGFEEDHDIEWD